MRKGGKFSLERMRYAVPGVCNRFWSVHIGFILVCALICAMAISVTIGVIVIGGVQDLEPKPSAVFYCEVDDIGAVRKQMQKYTAVMDIYFVEYGDEEYKGALGEDAADKQTFAIVYDKFGKRQLFVRYQDFGLKDGATVKLSDVERLIAMGKEKV